MVADIKKLKEALKREVFDWKGQKAIALENYGLDFKKTYLYKGITKSGNVKLGDVYSTKEGGFPDGVKNKIAKVIQSGDKKALMVGKGTGTYFLDLYDSPKGVY